VTRGHAWQAAAAVGAAALFVSVAIAVSGGGVAHLGFVTIGFRSPWPSFTAAIVLLAISAWRLGIDSRATTPDRLVARSTHLAALAVALCAALVAWAYGTESAAGADASGYLNAARLFADGRTSIAPPLAADAPWPGALQTMAPLGFRPGKTAGTLVPTYPPGLPLTLAAAMRIAPQAWPLVVPALACLAVAATFFVGTRVASPRAALLAACGVASSPVFLFHAVQPMSDVPVTAWWMLALAAAMRPATAWAGAGGLLSSMAIATRPNLAPLVLPVAALVWAASRRSSLRMLVAFAVGAWPGIALVAWLNTHLYGHPLESGYGATGSLFSIAVVPTNVARYAGWLIDVHPVALALACAGGVVWMARTLRTPGVRSDAPPADHTATVIALSAFALLNVGLYLVYAPFENWTYLRFLLPSFPLAAIAAADVIDRALGAVPFTRAPHGLRRPLAVVVPLAAIAVGCGLVIGTGLRGSAALGVFERRHVEARHEAMARAYAARATSSVFITQQHGGAVQFHLDAPIVRWDLIDPSALDAALAWCVAHDRAPVFLVDAEEEPVFRERFAGHGAWASLDWPARFETDPPQRARAYELADLARFRAGEVWRPQVAR